MGSVKKCTSCGEGKALEEFALHPGAKDGRASACKACKADKNREYRGTVPAEDKAEAARAYRAGMRKDKCAICGRPIEGYGICDTCHAASEVLGGLDGVKRAVRALRYLGEK